MLMPVTQPTIGRIVLYTLTKHDADQINKRREDGALTMPSHRAVADGSQVHVGNWVAEGDVFPMIVTRLWQNGETEGVNGQVMLDGNDTLWTTSKKLGDEPGSFAWPARV